ncbi:SRPBCC family protein [Planococcus sp. CAU13]|uniref:SRPBCC family protein n=1 Tax=Planococcus sp. CAU13 TaxID=1541197 RepID=UPI0005300496|nr:SRPBCC family protein [Planococcus sp. CAU13]
MAFKETVYIKAPVETVFAIATDFKYASKIMDNVVKAEKLTEGPVQAGTQIMELRNVRARAVETILHVTEFIANQKYTVKSESAGMTVVYEYLFQAQEDGTTVDFKGTIRSKGMKNMLIKPFFEKILKKEDENHLVRLKEYIEQQKREIT